MTLSSVSRTSSPPVSAPEGLTRPVSARMPDLDAYRAMAAIGVIIFHAYQFSRPGGIYPYGNTAVAHILVALDELVSLFLVLSAFLLYVPLATRLIDGPSAVSRGTTAGGFLVRRAVRILPLYWIAIIVVWTSRNQYAPMDWRDLIEHLTFTQVFDTKRIFYTIGPAWSLAVEVYFYVFLTAMWWLVNRLPIDRMSYRARMCLALAMPSVLIAASVLYLLWAVYIRHEPPTNWSIWFNPLAKADTFGAGMGLAIVVVLRRGRRPLSPSTGVAIRLGAVALLAYVITSRSPSAEAAVYLHKLATVGFALLLASSVMVDRRARWRIALSHRYLVHLGMISYSVYIWHEPIMLALSGHGLFHVSHAGFPVQAAVLVVLSLLAGWLSYWIIEYPGQQLIGLIRERRATNAESTVTG